MTDPTRSERVREAAATATMAAGAFTTAIGEAKQNNMVEGGGLTGGALGSAGPVGEQIRNAWQGKDPPYVAVE